MNAEESARKNRCHFKGMASNNGLGKRNDSKRSESCDYHPSYGVRAFEPRARSTEKNVVAERQQQKKSHRWVLRFLLKRLFVTVVGENPNLWQANVILSVLLNSISFSCKKLCLNWLVLLFCLIFSFQSNAVEQQKLGLSGSVPTVTQNPPSIMTKSTNMSKSMHADVLPSSSSRSTGKSLFLLNLLNHLSP